VIGDGRLWRDINGVAVAAADRDRQRDPVDRHRCQARSTGPRKWKPGKDIRPVSGRLSTPGAKENYRHSPTYPTCHNDSRSRRTRTRSRWQYDGRTLIYTIFGPPNRGVNVGLGQKKQVRPGAKPGLTWVSGGAKGTRTPDPHTARHVPTP
jgi:hypothetical protein